MDDYYKDFDKAISRFKTDCEKLKELLAEGVSYNVDIKDEIDDIREETYDLVDSCDCTEDDFDYINLPD